MGKSNTENALLALLFIAASIVIFPALGTVELHPDEQCIAQLASQYSASGVSNVLENHGEDLLTGIYAYLVSITQNLCPALPETFAVRLPSAAIILILTLGLYQFRGKEEKTSNAFLAALLFLSSYMVSSIAYHATAISLMALNLIFSLAALYHWVKTPTRNKACLLVFTTACASFFMGIAAPAAIFTLGFGFLFLQEIRKTSRFIHLPLLISGGLLLAYLTIIFIANDQTVAENILGTKQITRELAESTTLSTFAQHIIFSIFPWSIPILIALFWIACNPSWVKRRFLSLSLFKQFGIFLFILCIPTLFTFSQMSIVVLLAAIFFNMPIISNFLLSQTHNHSITWRITGGIFAGIIALFAMLFVAIRSGLEGFSLMGYTIEDTGNWSVWSVLLVSAIAISLYTLNRNQRTIRFNNRYLYNIVILYMLAQLLYKAYINPNLTVL